MPGRWTQNNLERAMRDELAEAMSEQEQHYNALGELKDFAGMLGQRLGEMHAGAGGAHRQIPTSRPQATTLKDTRASGQGCGAHKSSTPCNC